MRGLGTERLLSIVAGLDQFFKSLGDSVKIVNFKVIETAIGIAVYVVDEGICPLNYIFWAYVIHPIVMWVVDFNACDGLVG